jgi:hypothetical protein
MALLRFFEYAIHRESGDHTGSIDRLGSLNVSESIFVALPLATSIVHRFRWLSWKSSCLQSGDHASSE